jgi:hypothetical protein
MTAVCALLLSVLQFAVPKKDVLTLRDVQSWQAYYAQGLDKDISVSIRNLGEASTVNGSTRQWNPSPRTKMRTVFIEVNPEKVVLRITVYPRPDESLSAVEVLRTPEKYVFSSGVKPRLGSYFQAGDKRHTLSLLFLCAADRDPELAFVTFKSERTGDPDPL